MNILIKSTTILFASLSLLSALPAIAGIERYQTTISPNGHKYVADTVKIKDTILHGNSKTYNANIKQGQSLIIPPETYPTGLKVDIKQISSDKIQIKITNNSECKRRNDCGNIFVHLYFYKKGGK